MVLDDKSDEFWHGTISREEAERILKREECPKDCGIFLVRESSNQQGLIVLSQCDEFGSVSHNIIQQCGNDAFFTVNDGEPVHGLEAFIEKYMNKMLFGVKMSKYVKHSPPQRPPSLLVSKGETTVLHNLIIIGSLERASQLITSSECDINAKDENGKTAVHLVCENKELSSDFLKLLIDNNAHVDTYDLEGKTPIHYACQYRNVNDVQMLIKCNVNLQSKNLKTLCVPLHEAAKAGNFEIVKLLLKHNVSVRPRDKGFKFPVNYAIDYNYNEIKNYLESFIPMVNTSRDQWLHGQLDRDTAEKRIMDFAKKLLTKKGLSTSTDEKKINEVTSGIFLVRSSSVNKTDLSYKISVLYDYNNNEILHYIIEANKRFYFLDKGPYMNSLEHLVDYYSLYDDGIGVKLTIPVPPNRTIDFKDIQDMNRLLTEDSALNYDVSYENLEKLKDLGEGNFGVVFLGRLKKENVHVAVKELKDDSKGAKESFMKEATIMIRLRSPFVVSIYGIIDKNNKLMLVQEFLAMGSLLENLHTHKQKVNQKVIKGWAQQIASGMEYLEQNKFVHCDLATRNILMESWFKIKLGDFGLSRVISADKNYYKSSGGAWPIKWYAPESYLYGKFSHMSDVWSFGVTLWELYSLGREPYDQYDEDEDDDITTKIDDGLRLEQPSLCPNGVYMIMRECWDVDPAKRPSFKTLKNFFFNVYKTSDEI